jgi:ComF family protein
MYDRMVAEYGKGSAAGDSQPLAGMYDLVIPVPIYKKKKSRRGFNQADLIAGSFAKRAHLRYDPEIVIRIKNTVPMKGLSPEERRANISGAFAIRERKLPQLEGKRVLLVDDIFTTGSTLDELAALLKDPRRQLNRRGELRKGVSRVDFLAFAATADIIAE